MIYFDNASTTKLDNRVLEKFIEYENKYYANPSSVHDFADQTNKLITLSKKAILKSLNLDETKYDVIFTSGATESNNLAIKGYLNRKLTDTYLITTEVEHPSVSKTIEYISNNFEQAITIACSKEGYIDFTYLEEILKTKKVNFICMMLVNNETGNILNLKKVKELINKYNKNIVLFTDATQAIGKIQYDFSIFDMLTLSFHKIKGFKNFGLLIKKKEIKLTEQIQGGGQQNNLRSGTMNPPMYIANAYALQLITKEMETNNAKVKQIRDYIVNELNKIEEVHINTDLKNSSNFILNFSLTKTKASVVVEALSNKEIYVSTTSACSSHFVSFSKVIQCQYKDNVLAENSIRLSFIGNESLDDAKTFIYELNNILNIIKKR